MVKLSRRQSEIMCCLILGFDNRTIAKTLGVEYQTVASHIKVLMNKTGQSTRLELALWSFHNHRCSEA
jgi:two-component system nitrate/nitrite response regulator NarL